MIYHDEFIREITTVEQYELINNIERYLDRRQYTTHTAELNDIFSAHESELTTASFKSFHDFYFDLLLEVLSEYQITLIPDTTISLENLLVLCNSLYDLENIDHELALPILASDDDPLEQFINLGLIVAEDHVRYWITEIDTIQPSIFTVLKEIMDAKAAADELPSDTLSAATKLRVGKFLKLFNKESKLTQFIREAGVILSDEHFASTVIGMEYETDELLVRDLYLAYLFGETPVEAIADRVSAQLTIIAETDPELMQLMLHLEQINTKYLGV